jgi:nucleoid DNA-binding protein
MNVNKEQLTATVATKLDSSKKHAKAAIEAVFEAIQEANVAGKSVTLIDVMTFKPVIRAARVATIPGTTTKVDVPETKTVSVKLGKAYKEALNA